MMHEHHGGVVGFSLRPLSANSHGPAAAAAIVSLAHVSIWSIVISLDNELRDVFSSPQRRVKSTEPRASSQRNPEAKVIFRRSSHPKVRQCLERLEVSSSCSQRRFLISPL